MHDDDWLAQRFEEQRGRLKAIAARMLGSSSEADDALQETWLRLSRCDADSIENLGGWLTTVLSRVCLNILQSRRSRPEAEMGAEATEPVASAAEGFDPEHEALLADSVGLALLVVLDALTPSERVAFVLHDMFGVSFEEIAPVVGRSEPAARQLASRARRRVRQQDTSHEGEGDRLRQARLVEAFQAAARDGDFEGLLALLDPEVVLRADEAAVRKGAPKEAQGAAEAAGFLRRARGATPVLLDGQAAMAWIVRGEVRVVYEFTVSERGIATVDLMADPERLRSLDLVIAGSAGAPAGSAGAPAGSAGALSGSADAPSGSAGAPSGSKDAPAGSADAPSQGTPPTE